MNGNIEQRIERIENQIININKRLDKLEYYYKMMGYSKDYEKNLIQISEQGG